MAPDVNPGPGHHERTRWRGIYRDRECLARVANEGPARIYSVSLFQMVERLLANAAARQATCPIVLRDIELYAVANGPGSFTGIRVGLAAARGWAKAFDRPIRGISVLEAMVEEAQAETDWAVPILDARRGEFFLGFFRGAQPSAASSPWSFQAEGEGWVLKPDTLATFLRGRLPAEATVTCLAREHDALAFALQKSLPHSYQWRSVPGTLLGAIARLALAAHQDGRLPSPAELDAYYIRRPDAELNWRD
jgi:tRNA threonylcarbamoyl adenosine modification protein YeaZ